MSVEKTMPYTKLRASALAAARLRRRRWGRIGWAGRDSYQPNTPRMATPTRSASSVLHEPGYMAPAQLSGSVRETAPTTKGRASQTRRTVAADRP